MSIKRDGKKRKLQRWRCRDCRHVWLTGKRSNRPAQRAYRQYSAGRQTLGDLSKRTGKAISTLRRTFDGLKLPVHERPPPAEPVALTFDGTFFGRGYGLLIYRAGGRNIHWQEIESERLCDIEEGLLHLKKRGWKFSSVTLDGRKGAVSLVKKHFPHVPIQMCLFHQKAIVRRYLTGRPKTPCGIAIKNLMTDSLEVTEDQFLARLENIQDEFSDFLKERNEQKQFMHRRLRSALRSLRSNAPWLFTHLRHPDLKIPTTTNSCDGSFSHWKAKVKIHRGLRQDRRSKMISFLLAET